MFRLNTQQFSYEVLKIMATGHIIKFLVSQGRGAIMTISHVVIGWLVIDCDNLNGGDGQGEYDDDMDQYCLG